MKREKFVHPKADALYINRLNKIKVLGIIHEAGPLSRADIVKISGLSAPTVTRIVDGLIHDERLVVELGMGSSSGGRPPLLVKFNGEQNYVIGIDLGGTNIRAALITPAGEIKGIHKQPTRAERQMPHIVQSIAGWAPLYGHHPVIIGPVV